MKRALSLTMMAAIMGMFLIMAHHSVAQDHNILPVGSFSTTGIKGWAPKKFVNETRYEMVTLDDRPVLEAQSRQAASGLIKKIKVNIDTYPFLNWSWRIENRIQGEFNEKEKPGDDYAARIYVVRSGGIAVWNTRALNYVWAKHSPKGDIWPNAFAPENATMMALRSFKDAPGTWYREKRNIRDDFKQIFGKDIKTIDAVVLMTDTDNTQKQVTAHYGDIFFSSK